MGDTFEPRDHTCPGCNDKCTRTELAVHTREGCWQGRVTIAWARTEAERIAAAYGDNGVQAIKAFAKAKVAAATRPDGALTLTDADRVWLRELRIDGDK